MATISLRLNDADDKLFKNYAALNHQSLSEMIKTAVLEKIEDEYDRKAFEEAMEEFRKNPITYTHKEVWGEFGL